MIRPFLREALLQEPTGDDIRCGTCERRCVLPEGETGWCGTRRNVEGNLLTVSYGAISSLTVNTIEKKPLFHFHPGSVVLTAGSWSCNAACPWCQNSDVSKQLPIGGEFLAPLDFVKQAERSRCGGVSISFNEPTLSLEWALDVFRAARRAGLHRSFITNGYMTEEALEFLAEAGLDAMNVDVKGDEKAMRTYCQLEDAIVWRNCRKAKALEIWIELTTLVIPGVNDDPEQLAGIAERIVADLGADTPWHVTRYTPAFGFSAPATLPKVLAEAYEIGREAGLRHVYIGNLGDGAGVDTYCPGCQARLLARSGLRLLSSEVTKDGRCPFCEEEIPGRCWPG